jgi:hypothetical protein
MLIYYTKGITELVMEQPELRKRFDKAVDSIIANLKATLSVWLLFL